MIEVTEAALADVQQSWADNEEEDVAEAKDKTALQPEAATVSEIVLEEDAVHTETAVAETSTELTLAVQSESAAAVEEITFVSSEGPVSSDKTVVSELQETTGPEVSWDVTIPPEDRRASEPLEAPVIQDEAVASFLKTTTAPQAPLAWEVSGPKGEGEDVALMEAQVSVEPLETRKTIALCETEIHDSVAAQEVTSPEDTAATIAGAPVNCETSEYAGEETTPESLPMCPVIDCSKSDISSSDEEEKEEHAIISEVERPEEATNLRELNATPAPEEECEAADLDLVEEVPASLPIPLQTPSEEDIPPQAETMSAEFLAGSSVQGDAPAIESLAGCAVQGDAPVAESLTESAVQGDAPGLESLAESDVQGEAPMPESLAVSAAQGDAPAIESMPADLSTVSIFR